MRLLPSALGKKVCLEQRAATPATPAEKEDGQKLARKRI